MALEGGAGWCWLLAICWTVQQSHAQITFTSPPSNVLVPSGSPATLDCTFTSSRAVSVNWQRSGRVLPPSPPKYTYLINNSLVISPTEAGDEGTYSCVVTDRVSMESVSQSASLTFAFILNSFVSEPESQTVDEGSLVFFFCIHSGSLPPASITWTINGDIVTTSSRVIIQTSVLSHTSPQQVSSSLAIAAVQRSDTGSVVCTARNSLLPSSPAVSAAATLSITVQPFPPSITRHPADVVTPDGGTANFTCSANGSPPPSFTWTLGGILVAPSTGAAITFNGDSSTLVLTNVRSTNTGTYQCTATNSQGTASSNTAQLQIARLDADFTFEPLDTVAIIGQDAILNCTPPASSPPAVVTWSRDLSQLSDPRYQVQQNGSLLIRAVQLSDQSTYFCTATNPLLGTSRLSRGAVVTAIGEPSLTPSVATVPVGQSAAFFCSAVGSPLPQITWYRGTNQLTADTPRVTITGSTLTITGIVVEDRGHYTCRAVFPSGTTEAQAFLNILIPPSFQSPVVNVSAIPAQPVTLPCSTFPDPTLTYTWSFNGAALSPSSPASGGPLVLEPETGGLTIASAGGGNEGVYMCTASNNVGSANGTVYLNVLVIPVINADSAVVSAIAGSIATLRCVATGEPDPIQTWTRDGAAVSGARFQISADGRVLTVTAVAMEDGGVYTCHASNAAGIDSTVVTLDVQFSPAVQATPTSLSLNAGSSANFTCTATGNPTPQLMWLTQDSTDVSSLGDSRIQVTPGVGGGLTLVIRDLQASDQQQYVCQATNLVSTATATVPLFVLVFPMVNISAEIVAVQGSPLTLDCQASGQPTPAVTWFRGSAQIVADSRLSIDVSGRLVFSTVFSTDAGTYRCQASNDVGSASADTIMVVLVVPIIQTTTRSVTASDGSPAVLDCLATGNPPPVVTWFFNSAMQLPTVGDTRVQQAANSSLVFAPVRAADEGNYTCRATNTAGTESVTVQLIVHVGPLIVAVETMVTAVTGTETTLRCTATGDPVPLQSWTQNGAAIVDSRFQVVTMGSALRISNVREEDQGVYQCHASNVAGTNTASVNLNIISVPVIRPPTLTPTSVQGSSVVLECPATGDPPPTVTWFFNSAQLPSPGYPRIQQASNGSLLIFPVETRDRGGYLCRATNMAGNTSVTLQLTVYVAPVITAAESSVTVIVGGMATLSCTASGDPTPTQTWSRSGVGVAGPRIQLSADGSSLTISSTTLQDEGTYTCHASNPAGMRTATVSLNIIVPPTIAPISNSSVLENTAHSMTCSAAGDPTPSITWMFEGRVLPTGSGGVLTFAPVLRGNSGAYTCTATNTAGSASTQVHLEVQYSPEIVRPLANASIPIGAPVSFTCVPDSVPPPNITWLFNSVVIPGAQQPTYTITMVTGADAGTYTCVASNSVGIAFTSATLTTLFPPSSPFLFSASATSPDVIGLQWSVPTNDGGALITGYVVEFRDAAVSSSQFMSRSFGTSTLSADLDNLMPFINYEIRVLAENVAGLSGPSNAVQARTHPAAPSSPTDFAVSSSAPATLSLTWGRPDQLNGMFAVYQLRYAPEDSFTTSSLIERILFVPQFTVSGVELGVVYRVEVRASTIGLLGETLFGPFAVLRVRDGIELEIPVTQTPPPTTAPPTTPPPTTPPPTTPPPTTPPPTTPPPTTPPPTTPPPTTPPPTTLPPTTPPPTSTTAEPSTQPMRTETQPATTEPQSPEEPETTEPPTSLLNLPTSIPIGVMAVNVPGTFGDVLVYWREPFPVSDDYIGYSISVVPAPPPSVTTPILVPRASISVTRVVMGLANFTTYTFTVATYNEDGLGPQTQTATVQTPESAPSAPRTVRVDVVGESLILVSWLPPAPPNGILTSYTLQVLREPEGELFRSTSIPVGVAQQMDIQSVTVSGLDLVNVGYRVHVFASTGEGMGPSSDPIRIGAELVLTTANTSPEGTTAEAATAEATTADTTSEETTPEATPATGTSGTLSPETTPTLGSEITESVTRDGVYYVIRIVPPLVAAFLLVALVLIIVFCCLHHRSLQKTKGRYQVHDTIKNQYNLEDMPDMGVAESLVLENGSTSDATDDSEFIKDQFHSNFTTSAGPGFSGNPSQQGVLAYNQQPSESSFDTSFGVTSSNMLPPKPAAPSSAMGRDAVQEVEEHPEEFMASSHSMGSSHSGMRPVPPGQTPGEHQRGEVDWRSQTPSGQLPQAPVSSRPPLGGQGLSAGGLMETRIGAVGEAAGNTSTVPEASAYMY